MYRMTVTEITEFPELSFEKLNATVKNILATLGNPKVFHLEWTDENCKYEVYPFDMKDPEDDEDEDDEEKEEKIESEHPSTKNGRPWNGWS